MTMTRGDRDQRFEVTDVSRRGAHRARPHPLLGLLPVAALAVVVVAVLGMAYVLFGRPTSTSDSPSIAGLVPESSASAAADPSAAASPNPEQGASPAAAASPSAVPEPAGTVDKSTTLNMFNATSPNIPGQSRNAAAELEVDGWTIGTVETWTGTGVDRTTVYYADPSQLATARAVVQVLGGGTVKINTRYTTGGLAVLVGNNYAP